MLLSTIPFLELARELSLLLTIQGSYKFGGKRGMTSVNMVLSCPV